MIGDHISHYRIVGKIGAGGMGEVYRARDPRLGRNVAIKVLPAEFSEDPMRLARFEREARVLASLNHPHVARPAPREPWITRTFSPSTTSAAMTARRTSSPSCSRARACGIGSTREP